jgi:hypothetical protein
MFQVFCTICIHHKTERANMDMQYHGATIRPMVVRMHGSFASAVIIRDENGNQSCHGALGRFASHNAAANFAVNWAIARLNGNPGPRPPFQVSETEVRERP